MEITEEIGQEYFKLFAQPLPHFVVKPEGRNWSRNKYPFHFNKFKKDHLETGKTNYGFIAKWYPGYCVLDIDNRNFKDVERIQGTLGLNDDNSFIQSSESPDSYHVIFRVNYRGKPETQKLLTQIMQPFAHDHGIEVYPQPNKPIRAPFGKNTRSMHPDRMFMGWEDLTYWFGKLDEFDLADVPNSQLFLPLDQPKSRGKIPAYDIGREYWEHGLQMPSSRDHGQFHVLYYLWRKNVPMDTAINATYQWVKDKHNGYSKAVNSGQWRLIKQHIEGQASRVYSYTLYPDDTHNIYAGFITKEDIKKVFALSDGSLPLARFLFNLVKFYYPRRQRIPRGTPIHSDLLINWSSRHTYQKHLNELEKAQLITRSNFYLAGQRSKDIILNWDFQKPEQAIIVDDRAPDTLESTLQSSFEKKELRAFLKQSGMDKGYLSRYLKQVYETKDDEGLFIEQSKHMITSV